MAKKCEMLVVALSCMVLAQRVDVHYIGIFACYMRDIKMTHDYRPVLTKEATSTLLSVSPMASKSYDGTTGEDNALTSLNRSNSLILGTAVTQTKTQCRRW